MAGCDPVGPGAAGQVTVVAGESYQGLPSLELIAYPDDGEPFDSTAVSLAESGLARSTMMLDTPPPWDYLVGEPVGTTSHRRWRVVAWMSTAANGAHDRIATGSLYGTTRFDIGDCGLAISGYCGVTDNVDIVLDQRVPEEPAMRVDDMQ